MAKHHVTILWRKTRDNLEHYVWRFDNGIELNAKPGSPSSRESVVDPESAFIASISSCHMLSVMATAAKSGFTIRGYKDKAVGALEQKPDGRIAITRVLLQPDIEFDPKNAPDEDELRKLHEVAHENCFIANSVNSEVRIEPVIAAATTC